ncbi:MAG: hypothetical protein Q8O94_02720 [bacterium]|nr:hypothetical protein [bacterium]
MSVRRYPHYYAGTKGEDIAVIFRFEFDLQRFVFTASANAFPLTVEEIRNDLV